MTAVTGWAAVWPVSAGARGKGTIVKVSLPVTFSYHGSLKEGLSLRSHRVCMDLTPRLTALKLTAKIVYSRWKCERKWVTLFKSIFPIYLPIKCSWGGWEVYKSFGEWEAIDTSFPLISECSDDPEPPLVAKPDVTFLDRLPWCFY